MVTAEPFRCLVPAPGLCLITLPWSLAFPRISIVWTVKPAPCRMPLASSFFRPLTSGTVTFWVPFETVIVTRELIGTRAPPVGVCEITWPFGLSETASWTVTRRLASWIAA